MEELLAELAIGDGEIVRRLELLVCDAGKAWRRLFRLGLVGGLRYPVRRFRPPYHQDTEHDRHFAKVVAAMEAPDTVDVNIAGLVRLAGGKKLPTPIMARRLRVTTAELPPLLCPVSNRGPGADIKTLWRIVWDGDAWGLTDEQLGARLGINRVQIWKIRRRACEKIASQLAPLLNAA